MRRLVTTLGVGLIALLLILGARPVPFDTSIGPAAASSVYSNCMDLQSSGGESETWLYWHEGVIQPLGVAANVAACSLHTASSYGSSLLETVQWDPLTLSPDPATIRMRTLYLGDTQSGYNPLFASFSPPLVLKRLPHLADPPRTTYALSLQVTSLSTNRSVNYDTEGDPTIPPAIATAASGAPRALPGAHPVLAHTLCGGDAALQSLYVVQSVMTTSASLDTSEGDLLQRFRVPLRAKLRWIELASRGTVSYASDPGEIRIFEAPTATPLQTLPPALVQAPLATWLDSAWVSHYDFDNVLTLEPDRDYWLLVRLHHNHRLFARTLTGAESSDFTEEIGGLFSRPGVTGAWTSRPALALSFRIIGEPLGVVGVAGAEADASSLRLRVSPNPSRGIALVSWSGAQGNISFDVLDVRGRRVGGARVLAATQGRWTWPAMSNGRALPAGVYFIRAQDERGSLATERLVLIR
jgi:hypothetical protein